MKNQKAPAVVADAFKIIRRKEGTDSSLVHPPVLCYSLTGIIQNLR